ncbi:MAG: DNA-binding protein [Gammaproteobacteria bacterium]
MTLANLLKIGQLKAHEPDAKEIGDLLAAARRSLADARVEAISPETRFDAAYRAIMQCALVALMANGYRPDTNRPGHHATVIQVLPTTMGIRPERLAVLDVLRRKRNLADYLGRDIDSSSVEQCIDAANTLRRDVEAWLRANHPELIKASP